MFWTVALIAASRNWVLKKFFFFSVVGYGGLHLSFCDITECLHSLVFMYGDPIIADVQVLMVYFNQIGGREASLTSLGIFFIRVFICSSISALFCVTTK